MSSKIFPCLVLSLAFLFIIGPSLDVSASPAQDKPHYVYLVCTSDPAHTINVSWRTDENYTGEVRYDTVSLGSDPNAYSYSAEGTGGVTTSEIYGYIHHVELTGLEPGTIYYFICGDSDHGWSEELSFKTAPVEREHIRFVQGGDSRSEQRSSEYQYPWPDFRDNISKLMASYNPDFVLFTGDYLWSSQDPVGGDTWDNWLGAMFKYWRTSDDRLIPIIPVIGNHEVYYPEPYLYNPTTQASNYYMIFDLPVEENRYAWYSLNWGPDLHIIALDSEILNRESDPWNEQVEWLGEDLLEHMNDLIKIAADHRPVLEEHSLQSDLSMEFDMYHLDIMFSGHVHCYKRSHPLNFFYPENEQITEPENGTIYVVSPGWGEQPEEASPRWYAAVEPIPERQFVLADLYENGTFYLRAINIDNEIIDEFTIQKSVPSVPSAQGEGMPLLLILGSGVVVTFLVVLLVYRLRSS